MLVGGLSDPQAWRCWAEAALQLQAGFASLPARSTRSYHSFTRSGSAALWARFTAACGVRSNAAGSVDAGAPLHVQIVAFFLR